MKCPHCKKELFGKSHDVEKYYETPKELTPDERIAELQAENERLKAEMREVSKPMMVLLNWST